MTTKTTNVLYWVCTVLVALLMGLGSIPNIMSSADSVAIFAQLGYPTYLLPFLGVAKLLGVIAILVPGFPRVKEWAYAGLTFDLAGAMYSMIAIGEPMSGWLVFLLGFAVIAGSYVCYHRKHKSSLSNRIGQRAAGSPEAVI